MEKLGAFYYSKKGKGSYWLEIKPADYTEMDGRNLKLHMKFHKIYTDEENNEGLKFGDELLIKCQRARGVDYAGPLAGHRAGIIKIGPKKILVTSEIRHIQPVKGDTDNFDRFLGELLGAEQSTYFLLWLKMALESLEAGDFMPGQALVLAGESGCGKSFLQLLITEFLGGRMAKPYRYMTGDTAFNSDLAGAEHLMIADEHASVDIRSRREFGAKLKDATVNTEMSLHAKGCDALTVRTFRRLSISCNDEAENLMILPPLDDSILDKVMLLKCRPATLGQDRKRTWSLFMRELPAMVHKLKCARVPRKMADTRYGVKAFQNGELLSIVSELSPEKRLLALIDEVIFAKSKDDAPWDGSAIELERELRKSEFSFAVEKLLHFSSACGVYLQRLAGKLPDLIDNKKNAGKTYWLIKKG